MNPHFTVGTGTPQTVYFSCESSDELPMHSSGGPAMKKKLLIILQKNAGWSYVFLTSKMKHCFWWKKIVVKHLLSGRRLQPTRSFVPKIIFLRTSDLIKIRSSNSISNDQEQYKDIIYDWRISVHLCSYEILFKVILLKVCVFFIFYNKYL